MYAGCGFATREAPRPLCGSSGFLRALLRPMQKVTSTGNAIGGETMRRTSRYWLGGRLGLSPSAHSDARNPLGGFSISTSRSGRWGTTSSARPRESGDRVAPGCTVPLQRQARRALSADVFDDLDELVEAVAVAAGEVDELLARWTTAPRSGVPATEMPRPRRNSSSPSSRSRRSERSTVLVLTPRTAARSLAGGSRSPGLASPSAIARRISPATCS